LAKPKTLNILANTVRSPPLPSLSGLLRSLSESRCNNKPLGLFVELNPGIEPDRTVIICILRTHADDVKRSKRQIEQYS